MLKEPGQEQEGKVIEAQVVDHGGDGVRRNVLGREAVASLFCWSLSAQGGESTIAHDSNLQL